MSLRFVLDDIAESECDAIVYAATPAALAEGAAPAPGTTPEEERQIFASLDGDEARITYANDLYCTYVIHVPSPEWKGDGADAERLAHCFRVCLQLAAEHDCRSLALPLIGAVKTRSDALLLGQAFGLGERYPRYVDRLHEALVADPATLIVEFTGAEDESARRAVDDWCAQYAR